MMYSLRNFLVLIVAAVLLAGTAEARSSDLDGTFGEGGKVATSMGVGTSEINRVVVQPDGKIVAIGYAQNAGNSVRQFAVVRYKTDGTLDTGFGNGGRVFTTIAGGNGYARDGVVLSSGKILVVGMLDTGSRYSTVAVRYNSNGSLDTTFNGSGIRIYNYNDTSSDSATGVVIQPDGKALLVSSAIVLIGNTPVYSFFLSRLNTNGSLDTVFNGSGKSLGELGDFTTGHARIGLQPDGKIVVAGPGGSGANIDFAVIRFTANGGFDPTFGNAGRAYINLNGNDVARDLLMLPDGKFVVVGYSGPAGNTMISAVGYTSSGGFDTSFGFFGVITHDVSEYNDVAESIARQADGRIVIVGRTGYNLTNNDMVVLRYKSNGAADSAFSNFGFRTYSFASGDDIAYSAAVQPNGRIVVAGSAETSTTTPGFALIRLLGRGTVGDFDGDGRADVGTFRPSDGTWYVGRSASNTLEIPFGNGSDIPLTADFDADGVSDIAVYRPSNGTWYILRSSTGFTATKFGLPGDIPVPADRDGDSKADISVFRPSTGVWYYLKSSVANQFHAQQFGLNGDIPLAGDYDGDGNADIAVFRTSSGIWYINGSSSGFFARQFGISTDRPVSADLDGDQISDLAVFRPSTGVWHVLRSSDDSYFSTQFGTNGDHPQAADFDGDGRADLGIFRPSAGSWHVQRSSDDGYSITNWGAGGDRPVASPLLQ